MSAKKEKEHEKLGGYRAQEKCLGQHNANFSLKSKSALPFSTRGLPYGITREN